MGAFGKYTKEEREIARDIKRLQSHNHNLRKKYLSNDLKIIVLKAKLGGKYKERK
ncbi:MAG: hypothetical protein KAQ85_00755 [Thermodesulfovibrionia bacterium]|nr:hypothetical protein [Thermodesulfovibrionia bacterium]